MHVQRWLTRASFAMALLLSALPGLADEPGSKYLRFVETNDHSQLQTSIIRFTNKEGVKVDLIGAVHIGDRAYYEALNKRFKAYDALLYEMVKPRAEVRIDTRERAEGSGGWVSGLQRFMKSQLELDFQLDRIDYTPENFVHADLDAEAFAQKQADQGESMLSLMLEAMMKEMNRPTADRPAAEMGIMDLIEALQAPDRGRQLKLVLGRQFNSFEDALSTMGGKDGSVILDERNKHALQVLKQQIDAGKKEIGIFYGAGHMKGMEEIMTTLMGFKQVGEPEWLVAWDIDARPAPAAKPLVPATQPAEPAGVQ
jgi:hypothetical protein